MTALVATIVCGRCAEEHRSKPGLLGTVERPTAAELNQAPWWRHLGLMWWTGDRRPARVLRGDDDDRPFPDVPISLWLRDAGDTIPTACRVHGPGLVRTTDVAHARGTVVVKFTATG